MKTAVKIIAVIMVLATITVLFASCGKTLNGTYKPTDGVGSLTFDKDGNVADVKESISTKEYQKQRDQIDDVVARAKTLLCGFKCEV